MQRRRSTRIRSAATVSIGMSLGFFSIFVLVGVALRMNQGELIQLSPEKFYAMMTAHGLGMAASLFICSYSAAWYLLCKYIRMSIRLMWIVFLMNLIGFIGVIVSTMVGNFGPGWYMLYPLPFILETWHPYTTTLMIYSLACWGFSWLFIMLDMLRAIGSEYGSSNILGWQYLKSSSTEIVKIPPIILIASVSSIAGIISMFSGANLLILYLLKWENLQLNLDPILLKNMVFLFGHTLVNITIYYAIGTLYEILPKYTKRPWLTNKVVVYSWNATLILVIGTFFHHLSMDFSQSLGLQFIGQVASYLSCVPATVVTVMGAFAQIFRSGTKLSFAPLALMLGLMGWAIGGFAAMVDSTIPVNITFHNTLWVPGHFHTYFIMGVVLILFGFVHCFSRDITSDDELSSYGDSEGLSRFSLLLMLSGGYGFVAMFYIGGILGVPRRFAEYSYISIDSVRYFGVNLATVASLFALIFFVGVMLRFKAFFGRKRGEN